MQTALLAPSLLTPDHLLQDAMVLVEDGRIAAVGRQSEMTTPKNARVVRFPQGVLAPGFIDVHIHGGAGHDLMRADAEAVDSLGQFLARHGVTSYAPTTVTAPLDLTLQALERLGAIVGNWQPRRGATAARPLGLHLEGPFISHARRGVHPPELILEPTLERFDAFWNACGGRIGVLTIAPELPGALEVIAAATRRGVLVSLGHSDADLATAQAGVRAGGRHFTHTFNAMRPLDHRQPGLLGLALSDASLSAEIIADGVHVHPLLVGAFLRLKGEDRAVLVTDAISATGMGDGRFKLGNLEVEVAAGVCRHDGSLAGSVLTLDTAVRNAMSFAGWRLQQAVKLVTQNPARLLGLEGRKGVLAPGADADLVLLGEDGQILQTIVAGQIE